MPIRPAPNAVGKVLEGGSGERWGSWRGRVRVEAEDGRLESGRRVSRGQSTGADDGQWCQFGRVDAGFKLLTDEAIGGVRAVVIVACVDGEGEARGRGQEARENETGGESLHDRDVTSSWRIRPARGSITPRHRGIKAVWRMPRSRQSRRSESGAIIAARGDGRATTRVVKPHDLPLSNEDEPGCLTRPHSGQVTSEHSSFRWNSTTVRISPWSTAVAMQIARVAGVHRGC